MRANRKNFTTIYSANCLYNKHRSCRPLWLRTPHRHSIWNYCFCLCKLSYFYWENWAIVNMVVAKAKILCIQAQGAMGSFLFWLKGNGYCWYDNKLLLRCHSWPLYRIINIWILAKPPWNCLLLCTYLGDRVKRNDGGRSGGTIFCSKSITRNNETISLFLTYPKICSINWYWLNFKYK